MCEIVAAFLQTPLPKKEREVDVGEGKEKKRKEERRRGSWLVWKKMNTKHPLYQLGSAPFLPPFSLSTPSPSCACLSNLQPPLFLVVAGFCSIHTSHSIRAKQKQSGCHLFCACICICTCTCAQPKQHPSSVFVVDGAFHCRFARFWRYMPMDFCTTLKSAHAPTAMPSCLNSSCVCTMNGKPRHLTDAGLANGSDNDHRLDHGFNSL